MPPFVGLTGGIGAGKSTALAALERLGAAVLSSDAVVHELYASDPVRAAVVARFGQEVAPGGVVDRGRLAAVAFATAEGRAWLEALIWPLVRARVAEWRVGAAAARPRPRALVVEVPLLFEAGQDAAYDATIAITADEEVRHARALARGHEALGERAARQLSQEEKARRATFVVRNDGDVRELEHKLSSVLAILDK
ncbi:MAG TPA: dephospho-CoA kinase [Solirubrobacteraceae bacterium]|nr:dephospho-CoA kinase [Solirubrobacteraceae bacterium]